MYTPAPKSPAGQRIERCEMTWPEYLQHIREATDRGISMYFDNLYIHIDVEAVLHDAANQLGKDANDLTDLERQQALLAAYLNDARTPLT